MDSELSSKNKKKKVVTDSLFVSLVVVVTKLRAIIFLPFIIAAVGINEYGVFQQILVNTRLVAPLFSFALGTAFWRYTSKLENSDTEIMADQWWTVVTFGFISGMLGGLVVYLTAPLLSEKILEGKALEAIQVSALIIPFNLIWEYIIKFLQARKKFKLYSIVDILFRLLPYLAFVVGVTIYKEIFMGILFFTLNKVIITSSLFLYISFKLPFRLPSIPLLTKFLKYSWPLIISQISGGVQTKISRYFIGYFLGTYYIGIFSILNSVTQLIDTTSMPFRRYFGSYLPKLWDSGQHERVRNQIREGLLYYLFITVFIVMVISLYLEPLLILVFNKNVEKLSQIDAVQLTTMLLAFGMLFRGASRFYFQIIRLIEKNHFQLIFNVLGALFTSLVCYLFIPKLGILAAGLASCISYLLTTVICNFLFSININLQYVKKLIVIIIASLPFVLINHYFEIERFSQLLVQLIVGSICYLLIVFSLKTITIKQIKKTFT